MKLHPERVLRISNEEGTFIVRNVNASTFDKLSNFAVEEVLQPKWHYAGSIQYLAVYLYFSFILTLLCTLAMVIMYTLMVIGLLRRRCSDHTIALNASKKRRVDKRDSLLKRFSKSSILGYHRSML